MVQIDGRDRAGQGIADDVGGIETAAQAHFQNHDVAGAVTEMQHGNRRHELEFGGMVFHPLGSITHLEGGPEQVAFGDVLPIHLDAVGELDDIGAGEQARAIPRMPQDAFQEGTGGTLAVGPRNMHESQPVLGVAQTVQKLADAFEPQAARVPARLVDIGDGIEAPIACLRCRQGFRRRLHAHHYSPPASMRPIMRKSSSNRGRLLLS